ETIPDGRTPHGDVIGIINADVVSRPLCRPGTAPIVIVIFGERELREPIHQIKGFRVVRPTGAALIPVLKHSPEKNVRLESTCRAQSSASAVGWAFVLCAAIILIRPILHPPDATDAG